ncbi:MAG TPA: hypothetical protein EYG89_03415 [Bacteroidia bacterium]|nr:hypothetical protein [Bacteroidia bacterium]
MNIGISFWGFLSDGIRDTPDGGRIHRLPFLKALIDRGNMIFVLQKNRDALETNHIINIKGLFFSDVYPNIDVLLIEYRWEIKGRNTKEDKHLLEYTPDLERQEKLIAHYKHKIPIIIWDKDLKLKENMLEFTVVENTLLLSKNRFQLLFSYDELLQKKAINNLKKYQFLERENELIYIGNQYERDETFDKYINVTGNFLKTLPIVYGNWTKYKERYHQNIEKFRYVVFKDRLAYKDINTVYSKAFCTVLIAPSCYYKKGQITQRIFESISNLTIPFVPKEYQGINSIIVDELFVSDGEDVANKIRLFKKKGNKFIVNILRRQLKLLEIYSSKYQAEKFEKIYSLIK